GQPGDMPAAADEIEWAKNVIARPLSSADVLDLIDALGHGAPSREEAAAGALGFADLSEEDTSQVVDVLVTVARSDDAPDAVRGQCVEALGEQLEHSSPGDAPRQRAETCLLDLLRDSAGVVRFWSAFALGTLRSRRAVAHLRDLLTDATGVPG